MDSSTTVGQFEISFPEPIPQQTPHYASVSQEGYSRDPDIARYVNPANGKGDFLLPASNGPFAKLIESIRVYGRSALFTFNKLDRFSFQSKGKVLLSNLQLLFQGTIEDHEPFNREFEEFLQIAGTLYGSFFDPDRKNSVDLYRFLAVSIILGIDRAYLARRDRDKVWSLFEIKNEDFMCRSFLTDEKLKQFDPLRIESARDFYYDVLRKDNMDPRPKRGHLRFNVSRIKPRKEKAFAIQRLQEELNTHRQKTQQEEETNMRSVQKYLRRFSTNPSAPSIPVHLQKQGIIDVGDFVAYGRVVKPSKNPRPAFIRATANKKKKKPPTAGLLRQAKKFLPKDPSRTNVDNADIMASALIFAQSYSSLRYVHKKLRKKAKNKKKLKLVFNSQAPQYLKLKQFNFNHKGTTEKEILGKRYAKTTFCNKAHMMATRQAICQQVINHPRALPATKEIATKLLGQHNPTEMLKEQEDALLLSLTTPYEDSSTLSIVPGPALGPSSAAASAIKTIKDYVETIETFSMDDNYHADWPLRRLLPEVATVITSHQLNESAAYLVLTRVLRGTTKKYLLAMQDLKIPFHDAWYTLQKTCIKYNDPEIYLEWIEEIFESDSLSLEGALQSIYYARHLMHDHEMREDRRKLKVQEDAIQDMRSYIHLKHPSLASMVEHRFKTKLVNLAFTEGEAAYDPHHFNPQKVAFFMNSCVEVIHLECPVHDGPLDSPRRIKIKKHRSSSTDSCASITSSRTTLSRTSSTSTLIDLPGIKKPHRKRQQKPDPSLPKPVPCLLCNGRGHTRFDCRRYQEEPGNIRCRRCQGFHTSPCIVPMRKKQIPEPPIAQKPAARKTTPRKTTPRKTTPRRKNNNDLVPIVPPPAQDLISGISTMSSNPSRIPNDGKKEEKPPPKTTEEIIEEKIGELKNQFFKGYEEQTLQIAAVCELMDQQTNSLNKLSTIVAGAYSNQVPSANDNDPINIGSVLATDLKNHGPVASEHVIKNLMDQTKKYKPLTKDEADIEAFKKRIRDPTIVPRRVEHLGTTFIFDRWNVQPTPEQKRDPLANPVRLSKLCDEVPKPGDRKHILLLGPQKRNFILKLLDGRFDILPADDRPFARNNLKEYLKEKVFKYELRDSNLDLDLDGFKERCTFGTIYTNPFYTTNGFKLVQNKATGEIFDRVCYLDSIANSKNKKKKKKKSPPQQKLSMAPVKLPTVIVNDKPPTDNSVHIGPPKEKKIKSRYSTYRQKRLSGNVRGVGDMLGIQILVMMSVFGVLLLSSYLNFNPLIPLFIFSPFIYHIGLKISKILSFLFGTSLTLFRMQLQSRKKKAKMKKPTKIKRFRERGCAFITLPNKKSYETLIDTGASACVIDPEVLEDLEKHCNIPFVPHFMPTHSSTAGLSQTSFISFIDISIDGKLYENVPFFIHKNKSKIILGQNFLSTYEFSFQENFSEMKDMDGHVIKIFPET